jgi:hypothetical protein
VQREITSIFNQNKVILRDTKRAVTPYGGLAVFVEYLRKIEYVETVQKFIPIQFTSPNAIDPTETFTPFLVSVLSGARRFAPASLLRFDKALHCLLGIMRFPTDDTMRNLFKRFSQGKVSEFFSHLTQWQIQRLPERSEGYSLDLDSTVFERYGRQQGALRGYNPKKHGRPSHHPLLRSCQKCILCCMHGCGAATAVPAEASWNFSRKRWHYWQKNTKSAWCGRILVFLTISS